MSKIYNTDLNLIKLNEMKMGIYDKPENYETIKETIKEHGVVEPLIVNEETKVIISGNLRYQICKELGIEKVPVIYMNVNENDMDVKSIITNQTRIKSYSEILKEIRFFEHYYDIKQGQRTDRDPGKGDQKEKREIMLSPYTMDTRNKIKKIDDISTELYGKDTREYKRVFNNLDTKKSTLNGMYQHLVDKKSRNHNEQIIPETYHFIGDGVKIYNKSSEDMSEVESNSVNTIITSPPYYTMIDYGTGKGQLGMESTVDLYLDNLMKTFKECYRVLRDDGSLFVNINDCVIDGQYQMITHRFVIRMREQGWIFNDELVWIKNNPQYSRGKRSVRSHEPIFHFVKTDKFYYNDGWLKDLTDNNNSISYGTNNENPKVISGLDFRDGVLKTNVSSTSKLRKVCKEEKGIYMTHNATFPIEVPTICGLLTTKIGDTILDCFSGTSVVGEFSKSNQRYFIGYEIKSEFVMASEVRLNQILEAA